MGDAMEPFQKHKGGFRASAFIFVLSGLENMGFVANMVSLYLYFFSVMSFNLSGSATTLTNLMGTIFLLSLIGGFVADTYLSRLTACLLFGCIEVVGLALMSIQAYRKDLHPIPCGKSSCVEGGIAFMLYSSLSLLALGAGGLKGCLPAFGADQFDKNDPREAKARASYFNWLLLSSTVGGTLGVTIVVWVSTEKNLWHWGFFISTVATLIGLIVLALGKPFYRLQVPSQSPLIRIVQVIAMAIRNRKLSLPESADELYETSKTEKLTGEEKIPHTTQFRYLDKAAVLTNDPTKDTSAACTVTQVEEVKILTRMLPILASTIIMNTCLAQLQTFSVQQGHIMNRNLGKFQVPAASIPVIPLVFMSILIPIYDVVFVPSARKFTGHPSGITQLQRVGVGLVLSAVSMAVAGIVEVKRRNQAHKDLSHPISLFWLSFQYGIFGIADMFTLVGLLEFFYNEAPVCMRSLSTSFTFLSLSFGYFLSSIFVNVINAVTKRITPRTMGWLHGIDINQNNLNLFYWFLAVLSGLNFVNYLYWASWYKYKSGDQRGMASQGNENPTGLHLGQEDQSSKPADQGGVALGSVRTNEPPFSVPTTEEATSC